MWKTMKVVGEKEMTEIQKGEKERSCGQSLQRFFPCDALHFPMAFPV
jgi:hypothetical protein